MMFLHDCPLHVHGNLTSTNCLVTSRWSLQVADYGLIDFRNRVRAQNEREQEEHSKYNRSNCDFKTNNNKYPSNNSINLGFSFQDFCGVHQKF